MGKILCAVSWIAGVVVLLSSKSDIQLILASVCAVAGLAWLPALRGYKRMDGKVKLRGAAQPATTSAGASTS